MGRPATGAPLNRRSYDAVAARWDGVRTAPSEAELRYLRALLRGIPAGASVLDLGCGTGRPLAEWILAHGHRVTGVDQSEAMLALARERFPAARWVLASIERFPVRGVWDAVLLWDSLFHLERRHHEPLLVDAYAHLRPGGRLMLTCGGSAHPAFTDTMFGETFFYDSHPPERLLGLLRRVGFRPVLHEFLNPPTTGRDKGRYAVLAERP